MPGSSLWLLPPADHPLQDALTALIKQTSSHFKSTHDFIPHVTLTSELYPSQSGPDSQAWLDSLKFPPANDIRVTFEKLHSEDAFVRKLYIKCKKTDGLKKIAEACRQKVDGYQENDKALDWTENTYNPHLSLLYHDCSLINEDGLVATERLANEASVSVAGGGTLGGWVGGRVVLVPTDKPISQWIPIAERIL